MGKTETVLSCVSPRRGAFQRLASGAVRDVCCDDREDEPCGQEPPPVQLGGEVERNYPHLEQSHQLQDSRGHMLEQIASNTHTRPEKSAATANILHFVWKMLFLCLWSYIVWLGVPLFPLHEDQLSNNQGDDQYQHHLSVHGLMAFVFGMHPCMLHPAGKEKHT